MFRKALALLVLLIPAACSENDTPPDKAPPEFSRYDRFGQASGKGVAVAEDNTPVWFSAVVGGARKTDGEKPAKISWLKKAQTCSFLRPAVDDRLVQIHTNGSGRPSDVYAFSKADAQKYAQDYVRQWQQKGEDPGLYSSGAGNRLEVVDVVVTETEKPVYLVLSGGFNILWNIHKADKARISRVAVIGERNAGIVNLDPSVPVTVLAGTASRKCGVVPARRPRDSWAVVQHAKDGDQMSKQAVEKRRALQARYDTWFKQTFGRHSETVTIGLDRMAHAVVGPLPKTLEARVPYRGFDASTVLLMPTDHVMFAATEREYLEPYREIVTKQAAMLAGGDLAALNRN